MTTDERPGVERAARKEMEKGEEGNGKGRERAVKRGRKWGEKEKMGREAGRA